MSSPLTSTPVERYGDVLVKREDLCCPDPRGPQFSKMRGVIEHMLSRPEMTIGVLDTSHSQGGNAVAYACHLLGKRAVVYWPRRKADIGDALRPQQEAARVLGARLVALPAGRSAVLYHRAKSDLSTTPDSYMYPNALKLPEMVTATAAEVRNTLEIIEARTVVVSISSGTIGAGVFRGLAHIGWEGRLILHMGYSRSKAAVLKYVYGMAGEIDAPGIEVSLIDEGFAYGDAISYPCPFPSNKFYDLKAYRWLQANPQPDCLFWNVG